jgi:spermidine synthase
MTSIRRRRVLLTLAALLSLPVAGQAQRIVYEVRSQYQLITVQDTVNGVRQLVFEQRFPGTGATQSEMSLANHEELTLSYARHIMTVLPLVDRPRRLLIVGLGGGSMQRYLYRVLPDATIETVELDPVVRDIAANFFFLKEDRRQIVHVGDGRSFLEKSRDRYDTIFLDAFNASSIPYALTTQEFLRAVRARLADGGVACANVWHTVPEYADMLKTYAAVFPELHVVNCASSGNSIVVALPAKINLTVAAWMDKARAFEKTHPTGLDLPALVERGAEAKTDIAEGARVLRDADKGQGR